ncbi:MAG: 23S rRNA (guanosine(2251)-2'-O)-methyltransferase RlmB [Anaerolineales bacterium]|nr:23S rRNA (guanosine(2251)-2'-O)-methyltransferase RlmB [Anaerolineales bacterium]
MSSEILYKRNAVRECLRAGRRRLLRLLVAEDADLTDAQDILAEARRRQLPIEKTDRKALHLAVHGERHQNLLLEVDEYVYADLDDVLNAIQRANEPPLVLVLDLLQDPRNVGALLRTAEAMGVHGVVIQKRRGCGITPTVVNTAAGATEHLLIAQVTNLIEAMRRLKECNLWLAGLDPSADAQPIDQADLNLPLGLVIGNESSGLRRLVREQCDFLLRLPMYGRVQSLNAAVAGALALYVARAARSADRCP